MGMRHYCTVSKDIPSFGRLMMVAESIVSTCQSIHIGVHLGQNLVIIAYDLHNLLSHLESLNINTSLQ